VRRNHAPSLAPSGEEPTQSDLGAPETGTSLVPRGVAQPAYAGVNAQANPYFPASVHPAHLIPRQLHAMPHHIYPDLPAHVGDHIVPGLADRTGHAFFQKLQDWHAWPGIGVFAGVGCGWGAAATEPMHPWFGGVATGIGLVGVVAYGVVHVIGAINGDGGDENVAVGTHIVGLGGVAAAAFGVACITGISFLSAGVTLVPLAAGYYAWHRHRHSRIDAQRAFIIDYHSATTPTMVPMPGVAPASPPQQITGEVISHEEAVVRRAFEGMKIELQDVYNFTRVDADSFALTVVFAPAANVSPEAVIARRDILASALGARQVIALPTQRGHELRLTIRYGEIDPLVDTKAYPGPVARSIKELLPLGEASDSSIGGLLLWGTHSLIGGATNGGKSVLVKVLLVALAALEDAVVWLVDLKPGRIELGVFEPIADRSARDISDAALMLEALIAVAKARGDYLAQIREETGRPVEKWDPAVHGPVLVVVFDELAELLRQGKKVRRGTYEDAVMDAIKDLASNFETGLQVLRALGIQFVVATQSPDGSVTSGNGKGGLDQIQNLASVQTAKISQTNIILGQGAHGDGYRAHTDLYVPGMFYLRTPQVKVPIKYKGYWLSNDEIVEYIERYGPTRPRLDDLSADAAAEVLGDIGATPLTGPPGDDGGGVRPVAGDGPAHAGNVRLLRSVPCYPDGTQIDDKHLALWQLLGSFNRDGATVGELATAAVRAGHENCSLAWVRDKAKTWRELGVVRFEQDGRDWRYWRDDEAVAERFKVGA